MTEAPEAHAPSGPKPTEPSETEALHRSPDSSGIGEADAAQSAAQPGGNDDSPADASVHEPAAQSEDAAEGDGDAEASDSTAAASEGGAAADGTGKRKRRRRKKKGKSEAGEQDAPGVAGEQQVQQGEPRPRRRENSAAPFLRFFTGPHAGRKHGFAVEEAVAGRVKRVADGTITIDLFGKAIAYADEHEPREVPIREIMAPPEVSAPEVSDEATPEAAAAQPVAGEVMASAATADVAVSTDTATTAAGTYDAVTTAGDLLAPDAQEIAGDASAMDAGIDHAAYAAAAEQLEDGEGDGETTLTGEASPSGHGPLPPAPVVPDEFPRLEPPSLGQVFRGRVGGVSESGHIAIVNRYVQRKAVLANLERYRADRRRVQGLVYGFNRGGFDVLVEGARAFCPASAMALEDIEDPTQFLGQKLEFLLPASQQVAKDIIVSRRSILERQLRKKARELVRSLEPGQKLKGRVTQVREFGLFVDIGGIEGLVHQSELSFGHGVRPGDVAQVGDEVDVQVLRVGAEPSKRDGGGKRDRVARVSLSMKALQPDPWDAHADALREGSAQLGKVTRTTDFGAFIELAPHIEGLLHITELGRDLKHASQAVKEGDELQVVIERVDRRARRISLSKLSQQELEELQAGAPGEEAQRSIKPGSRIKVKVARIEARGLVVRISGVLGKRARGYIPGIELPGGRGGDLRKAYPLGTELEVKVVGIDRDGGLRCSPKALAVDEERKAVKDYRREASKQGFGTFGDLLRAKLGQGGDPKQES